MYAIKKDIFERLKVFIYIKIKKNVSRETFYKKGGEKNDKGRYNNHYNAWVSDSTLLNASVVYQRLDGKAQIRDRQLCGSFKR